jgi:hypothetical protein
MAQTAIFSVIFPGNLPYFDYFLESLTQQSDQDFELFLLCDHIPGIDDRLEKYKQRFPIVMHHLTGSIAGVREKGLDMILHSSYQYIVFADTDDILGPQRVANAVAALEQAPIAVTDPALIDEKGKILQKQLWSGRIADQTLFDRHFIENSNVVGLGNAAIRLEILKPVSLPDDLVAVDWYLFYNLMHDLQCVFIHDGGCFYRQHQTNTVGASGISSNKLRHVVNTKAIHFKHLAAKDEYFEPHFQRHQRLADRIAIDKVFLDTSIETLTNQSIPYFWWEETEYIHE